MDPARRHPLVSAAWITGLGTLASRLLGMIRDMATAALLGMSSGGVMDAFVVAQLIPNLTRAFFAEGALTASYMPVVTRLLEHDRRRAWQLASVLLGSLAALLAAIVVLGEAACGLIWRVSDPSRDAGLLLGLTATMLPYAVFICLAAQVSATLNALGHFRAPSLAPTLLNLCWLVGAWCVAPFFSPDQAAQAYVLAVCVLVSGVLQLGVQMPVLFRLGFRFDFNWAGGRGALIEVVRAMGPMILGLAVTQINTLLDKLIAWGLAAAPGGPRAIPWLGGLVEYPMRQGAAAAIFYGERMYQFPLAILGLAVATAIFPLLSRHAARGRHDQLGADLSLGLRLVLCLGVPASAGLALIAEPLTRLFFERGQFGPDDTVRAAGMIAAYAAGVWAYCALPVVVRGFYAIGDRATPVRVGAAAVGVNLTLNLTLIWPLAERGLAIATATAAAFQLGALVWVFSRRKVRLPGRELRGTLVRTAISTAVMAAAGLAVLWILPEGASLAGKLARVVAPLVVCGGTYCGVYAAIGGREIGVLLFRREAFPDEPSGLDWSQDHADRKDE